MQLTQKLLGFLNRVFNKDPGQFLALRINYSGTSMTWQVQDGFLTTTINGGPGAALNIDLSQYTIETLVNFIAAQPGYTTPYIAPGNAPGLGALVLMDGSGDQSLSNGDHLYGYTSLLWAWLEANASELKQASDSIAAMPALMSIPTSEDYWLDQLGTLYAVPRGTVTNSGVTSPEPDSIYAPRIIYEILRPRGNNIALELAIENATGNNATVTDVVAYGAVSPAFNAAINFDGTHTFNASAQPIYGLFDVVYAFDLEGAEDITSFANTVVATIKKFRDAGTQLRALSLGGSQLTDTVEHASDSASLTVLNTNFFDGTFLFDNLITFSGSSPTTETLIG